ncbi:hypothetical protein J3R82DRAFT_926 [Butyriboletus roseoflavus]|nr:hypothetical protein J3R82DRAFT_926 [Butyriboletus roseoflavus]
MPHSEIDDIFAAPPKKKTKTSPSEQQQKISTKTHHPEPILDPSKKQLPKKRRRENPDNDRFKDSRGSAPRASLLSLSSSCQMPPGRKTVDGYNIYKEDELGISTTGGGHHLTQSLLTLFSIHLVQTPLFVRLIANAVSLQCLHPASSLPPSPQVSERLPSTHIMQNAQLYSLYPLLAQFNYRCNVSSQDQLSGGKNYRDALTHPERGHGLQGQYVANIMPPLLPPYRTSSVAWDGTLIPICGQHFLSQPCILPDL